jgi:hypothetical protein
MRGNRRAAAASARGTGRAAYTKDVSQTEALFLWVAPAKERREMHDLVLNARRSWAPNAAGWGKARAAADAPEYQSRSRSRRADGSGRMYPRSGETLGASSLKRR